MILYIGNKLSKHGINPTTVETLGELLSKDFNVVSCSDKKNIVVRMLDIVFNIIKFRKKTEYILIDTYSGLSFYYAFFSAFFSNLFNVKYIPILHGGNLPGRLKNSPYMSNYIFSKSYVNVSPSLYLVDEFNSYNYRVKYIPNAIDTPNYNLKHRFVIRPNILYVRAFAEVYNPQMAVSMFNFLIEDFPDAKLCMVGPVKDNSFNETVALASSLGLSDNISFIGRLSKNEWHELSKEYDVFINTTNADNMPVSIIEAMALGLVVVSTDAGGLPYLISDNVDGFLCETNNPKHMYEKIKKILIGDVEFYTVIESARLKAETFSWSNVRSMWLSLLNN